MTKFFLTPIPLALAGLAIIKMLFSLWSSVSRTEKRGQLMLLPHDFFQTLLFMVGMWVILFVIIASADLLFPDKQSIIVISALLAPFLVWWWKKMRERQN